LIFDESPINIFQGKNAQGKTNILEGIYVLALSKSFHNINLNDTTTWNETYSRITGEIIKTDGISEIECFWGNSRSYPKTLKINDTKVKSEKYIGNLLVILFTPEEINLILESPMVRRKHINTVISQSDQKYLRSLIHFQATLKNRNILLKKIDRNESGIDELEYWNTKLIEDGSYIYYKRRSFMKNINEYIGNHYEQIGNESASLNIVWTKEIPEEESEIISYYENKLQQSLQRDISAHRTLSGPHRDDIQIRLNQKDITTCGSRGQWRSAILALKLSEHAYLKKVRNENPILLLDDIFSEFDSVRQKNVLKIAQANQVIITTTDDTQNLQDVKVFTVENGSIK
jgi:DNA replication and repair protein RecF